MEEAIKVKYYTKEKLDVNENGDYYVLTFGDSINFKVSGTAEHIFSMFNGERTICEVCESLVSEGMDITNDDLQKFVDKFLLTNNLIEGEKFVDNSGGSRLWFHFPLIKGEKIKFLLDIFDKLYVKNILILQVVLFFGLQLALCLSSKYVDLLDRVWNNNTFIVLVIVFLSSIFHEFGHAVAANFYKCKVGNIGVGLYLFKPVLYTDLSSTWKIDRKKRVLVDFGGIYFQMVMVNVLSIICFFCNINELKVSAISIIILAILNLNPFLRLDGYWILTDWIGLVNVNDRVFKLIKNKIAKHIFKKEEEIDALDLKLSTKIILYVYMFIYFVFTIVALGLGIYLIFAALTGQVNFVALFSNLGKAIHSGSSEQFFVALNKVVIEFIPYLYLVIMIFNSTKGMRKNKKNKGKNNHNML